MTEKEDKLNAVNYIQNFTNFLDQNLPGIVDEEGNWTWTGREGEPEIDGQDNVTVIRVGDSPGPPPASFACDILDGMPEEALYVIDGAIEYSPKFFLSLNDAIESLLAQQEQARQEDPKR